jgi:surface protein
VGFQINILITYLEDGGQAAPIGFEKLISLGILAPGEYTATIIQNNSLSVSWITNEPEENVSAKIYASHLCKWGDGAATAIACGGSNWSFLWSTGDTTYRIENLEPGNYSVTITADNGSIDSATVSIGRKYHTNITVGIDDCNSDNPMWQVSPLGVLDSTSINVWLRYSWSNGFGSLFSGNVTLENGKYWLTVSNFVGGCLTFDSIDLKPLELIVNYEGDIVHAIATGGIAPYKFQWSSGDTTSSMQVQVGELFMVTVTDALDCVREYNNRPKAPFVTTWDTSLPGSSDSNQIKIPGYGTNYTIHWEEVDYPENRDNVIGNNTTTLTFPDPGIYRVSITPGDGTFYRIGFSNTSDTSKILSIDQWGEIEWRSFAGAFKGCINLTSDAPDLPNLSNVTDMSEMFYNCTKLNGPSNIGQWDVSNVRDMRGMFRSEILVVIPGIWDYKYTSSFNQEISNWSVSNVTDMSRMFSGAGSFNQDIGNWDVSQVQNMEGMFYSAYIFNQDIGSWNVGNVTNMSEMFYCFIYSIAGFGGSGSFNQNIGNWDVSNVKNMYRMLSTSNFNQNIGNWDVSKVTNMSYMFERARSFNQDIGGWNVGNVDDMSGMFEIADSFNGNIGAWDVSNVLDMSYMFRSARAFNQDIGLWDVRNVTNMSGMLSAAFFNQEIGNWNVANVTNMSGMFFLTEDFNKDIGSWDVSSVTNMSEMFSRTGAFNQDIGNWNVSSVTDMRGMFLHAKAFNQDLGDWDVSNVTNMSYMFYCLTYGDTGIYSSCSFNQYLGNWDVTNVKDMRRMFDISGIQCDNYSSTLIGWNKNSDLTSGINLGAQGMKYGTEAVAARNNLILEHGWTFSGDSPTGIECNMSVSTEDSEFAHLIKVLPNPFSNQLFIEISENENATIIFYDQLSRQVLQQSINGSATIDTEHLPAGMYMYELRKDQRIIGTGKIIRQR